MRRPEVDNPQRQATPRPRATPLPSYRRRRPNLVVGGIQLMGDCAVVLVVIAGIIGAVLLVLGGLAALEVNATGPNSILKVFVSADLWVRRTAPMFLITPVKLWGSYALALGAQVTGWALASAVVLDIMISLRRPS